jgi:hypothetical protein
MRVDDSLAFRRSKEYHAHSALPACSRRPLDGVSPQLARDQGWQLIATSSLSVLVPTTANHLRCLVEIFGDEVAPFISQAGIVALAPHHPIAIDGVLKGLV